MEIIDILKIVVEAGKDLYSQFGYYPSEELYKNGLRVYFTEKGIKVEDSRSVPIIYRGYQIGNAEMDLVLDDKIVVELKRRDSGEILRVDRSQLKHYLRNSEYKFGIIVCFGVDKICFEAYKIENEELKPLESLYLE
jgi:GxxExxY protein